MKYVLPLIGFILLAQFTGLIGSYFAFPAINTWYADLHKPFFTPPNWIFGPVWTTLYIFIGIAAFLVYKKGFIVLQGSKELQKKRKRAAKEGLSVFGFQLAVNSLWSILFFGFKSPLFGFIGIILLWIASGVTIQRFARVSFAAAFLQLSYIFWVTFILMLNLAILLLN